MCILTQRIVITPYRVGLCKDTGALSRHVTVNLYSVLRAALIGIDEVHTCNNKYTIY